MNGNSAVEKIKQGFGNLDWKITIPLQRGRSFTAYMVPEGIMVDNLGNQPFLPWSVFEETVELLNRIGGRAEKGNAMAHKLGEDGLPLDSVEGYVAHVVYGKESGDTVFRRISPISAILVWAEICYTEPGELVLC